MTRDEFYKGITTKCSSAAFIPENHTNDNLTLSADIDDMRDNLQRGNYQIVGFSKSTLPQRPDEYGLMLESQDTFDKKWYHVDYRYFREWKRTYKKLKDKDCKCLSLETYLDMKDTKFENGEMVFYEKIYAKCPNCGRKYMKVIRNGSDGGWHEISSFQTTIREGK